MKLKLFRVKVEREPCNIVFVYCLGIDKEVIARFTGARYDDIDVLDNEVVVHVSIMDINHTNRRDNS